MRKIRVCRNSYIVFSIMNKKNLQFFLVRLVEHGHKLPEKLMVGRALHQRISNILRAWQIQFKIMNSYRTIFAILSASCMLICAHCQS